MNMKLPYIAPQTIAFVVIVFIFVFLACACADVPTTKVDLMAYCDDGLDKTLLSEPCAKPQGLAASAVFQDSLAGNKASNTALDQCGAKAQRLQKALADCHDAVVNHNQVIQSIADTGKKK